MQYMPEVEFAQLAHIDFNLFSQISRATLGGCLKFCNAVQITDMKSPNDPSTFELFSFGAEH